MGDQHAPSQSSTNVGEHRSFSFSFHGRYLSQSSTSNDTVAVKPEQLTPVNTVKVEPVPIKTEQVVVKTERPPTSNLPGVMPPKLPTVNPSLSAASPKLPSPATITPMPSTAKSPHVTPPLSHSAVLGSLNYNVTHQAPQPPPAPETYEKKRPRPPETETPEVAVKRRLLKRLEADYIEASLPDFYTPFKDLDDAFERLLPFYVFASDPNETTQIDYATLAENTNKCIEKFKQLTNTIRQKYATLFDITDGLLVPREERALMQRLLYSESQEAFAKEKAAFQQQIQQQASRPT